MVRLEEREKTDNLKIRFFKSKFTKGRFTPPNTVWIAEGLTQEEFSLVFNHEWTHFRFYTRNPVGRLLAVFFKKKVFYAYGVCLALTWVFSPWVYMALSVPFTLDQLHECLTSLKYPSAQSFVVALALIISIYVLLWTRLQQPQVI